ncbi:MAG: helix-turn-helix transcriptional regulator [Solobacterium sp.]|nr:helix-turn-helix transcriptional regulator [Solobacterium sp.]MBR3126905.1 helix-turn-helix transcriptional regulator [Solobacterium sp.]
MNRKKTLEVDALQYFVQQLSQDEELRTELAALQLEYEAARALINLRIKNNLSQKELSEVAGIHQADISKIEHGIRNPSVELLAKIAEVLDMDLRIEFVPRK